MSPQEFTRTINDLRRANKDQWYTFTGYVEAPASPALPAWVRIKGFNTWLQIFTIDGIDHSNAMDQNVTQFKAHLDAAFALAGRPG